MVVIHRWPWFIGGHKHRSDCTLIDSKYFVKSQKFYFLSSSLHLNNMLSVMGNICKILQMKSYIFLTQWFIHFWYIKIKILFQLCLLPISSDYFFSINICLTYVSETYRYTAFCTSLHRINQLYSVLKWVILGRKVIPGQRWQKLQTNKK